MTTHKKMEEMKMEEMKMEQKRELKSGLGIASFVIGTIGFLTGFIAIGMYFDIIAVILGVIALISKKNKKGFAIAGLLIAASGFIIMMFLVDVFDGSDKTQTTKNKLVQATKETKETKETKDKEADKPTPEKMKSELTLGSTIELKNFTIVFNSYEIKKIDNQFADIKEAIVISTTITNTSEETQNMLAEISTTCFAPNGTEAGSDSQIYLNDEFPSYWQDDLRAKAVLETFFVCDYSADGKYIIEVGSMFGDAQEVFIDIKK